MQSRKQQLIEELALAPHPEGGYYRQTFIDQGVIDLGEKTRHFSTAIYYLLEEGNFSTWHRIQSDEVWHHYEGGVVEVCALNPLDKTLHRFLLGELAKDTSPQNVVTKGWWFAARLVEGEYALCGCTVAPGFDFADFEIAERELLLTEYPEHQAVIESLSR